MAANIVVTIRMVYNGGPWIRDSYDGEVIYQLDRFHIQQEIIRQIKDKEAWMEIRRRLDEGKPDDMLDYIKSYAESKAGSDENDLCSKNAMKLFSHLAGRWPGVKGAAAAPRVWAEPRGRTDKY